MRLLRAVLMAVLLVCMCLGAGLYQVVYDPAMRANNVVQVLVVVTSCGLLGSLYGLKRLWGR